MKNNKATIFFIFALIMGIQCLIIGLLYEENIEEAKNIADIEVSCIEKDYDRFYFDKVDVVERYAFRTMYEDKHVGDVSYSDVYYFVYDASQPMDKHELVSEYYIVKFSDKTGKEYIASMTVSTKTDIAASLTKTPLQISACTNIHLQSKEKANDSADEKLIDLKQKALDKYSQKTKLEQAPFSLSYQSRNDAEYLQNSKKSTDEFKKNMTILGAAATVISICSLCYIHKKRKETI